MQVGRRVPVEMGPVVEPVSECAMSEEWKPGVQDVVGHVLQRVYVQRHLYHHYYCYCYYERILL